MTGRPEVLRCGEADDDVAGTHVPEIVVGQRVVQRISALERRCRRVVQPVPRQAQTGIIPDVVHRIPVVERRTRGQLIPVAGLVLHPGDDVDKPRGQCHRDGCCVFVPPGADGRQGQLDAGVREQGDSHRISGGVGAGNDEAHSTLLARPQPARQPPVSLDLQKVKRRNRRRLLFNRQREIRGLECDIHPETAGLPQQSVRLRVHNEPACIRSPGHGV